MRKPSKKEQLERELNALKEPGLTPEELAAIRKFNGATSVPGYTGSKRTVEAVLQGRRSNPSLLLRAVDSAKAELDRYTRVMEGILRKIGRK